MRFDGHQWRRSGNIVTLPTENTMYQVFGRITKPHAKGSFLTTWRFTNDNRYGKRNDRIWAKPLPITGYSLTNMAYGKPTYRNCCGGAFKTYRQPMYLMKDGYCWTSSHEIGEGVWQRGQKEAKVPLDDIVNMSQGGFNE